MCMFFFFRHSIRLLPSTENLPENRLTHIPDCLNLLAPNIFLVLRPFIIVQAPIYTRVIRISPAIKATTHKVKAYREYLRIEPGIWQ